MDLLVSIAQRLAGVLGARLTGAGFGGATVTLCERSGAPAGHEDRRAAAPGAIARPTEAGSIIVLIPVFNDWDALQELLNRLDATAGAHGIDARVLAVDDGSMHDRREVLSVYAVRLLALADNYSVTHVHLNAPVPVKYDWRAASGSSGG